MRPSRHVVVALARRHDHLELSRHRKRFAEPPLPERLASSPRMGVLALVQSALCMPVAEFSATTPVRLVPDEPAGTPQADRLASGGHDFRRLRPRDSDPPGGEQRRPPRTGLARHELRGDWPDRRSRGSCRTLSGGSPFLDALPILRIRLCSDPLESAHAARAIHISQ